MFDKRVTFYVITITTNTEENGVRMKHVIEYTSAKPPHAWILASAWKQKLNLKIFEPGHNIIIPIGIHF